MVEIGDRPVDHAKDAMYKKAGLKEAKDGSMRVFNCHPVENGIEK